MRLQHGRRGLRLRGRLRAGQRAEAALALPRLITSDWAATHSSAAAADNGLDMEMPGSSHFGAALKAAVPAGRVPMSRLDDMVGRILIEQFRFHLFDREPVGDPSAVATHQQHAAVARRVAERGTVLLENSGRLLPLDAGATHSIAVMGPAAGQWTITGGGGSAAVVAPTSSRPSRA